MIREAARVVWRSKSALVVLNVLYFGLAFAGMAYGQIDPSRRAFLWEQVESAFREGAFSSLPGMASEGQVLALFLAIFLVNLFLGSVAVITLPSMVIPFAGLLMGAFRATLWGLIAPVPGQMSLGFIFQVSPFVLLVILEGEGYILAMLASYLQGKAALWPQSVGASSRWQGYRQGLKSTLGIYVLICLALAVAAAYEVLLSELLRLRLISPVRP